MVISLYGISEERKSAIQEFAEEFGLRISECGTEIVCRESDDLTAEYDGKTLTIGMRDGKGFFRALSLSANMPNL